MSCRILSSGFSVVWKNLPLAILLFMGSHNYFCFSHLIFIVFSLDILQHLLLRREYFLKVRSSLLPSSLLSFSFTHSEVILFVHSSSLFSFKVLLLIFLPLNILYSYLLEKILFFYSSFLIGIILISETKSFSFYISFSFPFSLFLLHTLPFLNLSFYSFCLLFSTPFSIFFHFSLLASDFLSHFLSFFSFLISYSFFLSIFSVSFS